MNIAYITTRRYRANDTSGGNIHLYQFYSNAIALGHSVATWREDDHPRTETLPENRWRRLLALRSADLIYGRIEDVPTPVCKISTGILRAIVNAPVVAWEFNTVPEFAATHSKNADINSSIKQFRKYAKGCDLAVCVSEKIAEYVEENFRCRNTIVIPNGSDPERFSHEPVSDSPIDQTDEILRIVWIGSGGIGWHDFELIQQIATLVDRKGFENSIHFHLIGSGLDNSVANGHLNMTCHGPIANEELHKYLAAMDVGIIAYKPGPAEYGSPLKMFDYMASGLAIIATEQPQVFDLLDEMDMSQFALSRAKPESVADAIIQLHEDRELLKEYQLKTRNLLIAKYSWRRAVQRTLEAVELLRNRTDRKQKD